MASRVDRHQRHGQQRKRSKSSSSSSTIVAVLPAKIVQHDILPLLTAVDVCNVGATCHTWRSVARHNGLWRYLFEREGWNSARNAPRQPPPGYWVLRYKRHVCGEALVRVQTLTGACFTMSVLSSDDKYSVKRRVRAHQARVDGFSAQDFELEDTSNGQLFGVRGDSMLPPNNLHTFVVPVAVQLPLGSRVQAYLQGLTERNADWTRTMDTLVDGTHFKQRLFGAHAADQERLELEGRAAGTRAGEQEGDSAPPTLQAHTRGRAASVRSNDSSNSTGSAGASSVITHVSAKAMYEQVIADVHRTVEESGWRHVRDGGGSPTYAGKAACLRLLQLRTCPLLLQRSLNRSVDPAKRRAASEALIKLVACSNTMLGKEMGARGWKIGNRSRVHPLLKLFVSGTAHVRTAALAEWVRGMATEVLSLRMLKDCVLRATLTWGAPAMFVRFAQKLPRATLRALSGLQQRDAGAGVFRSAYLDLMDTFLTSASVLVEVLRSLRPHMLTSVVYEVSVAVVHNIVRSETRGTRATAAACAITAAALYAWLKQSKYAIWRAVRGSVASAILWEVLASFVPAPMLILGVMSAYSAVSWVLLVWVRVRVGMLFED